MDIRLVILSVACFSCLVPPAMTAPILATKAVAALGGVLAAKGLAVKGLAKSALLGGAALLGAKAMKAKAALVLPKPSVLPPIIVEKPVMVPSMAIPVLQPSSLVITPPSFSKIFEKVTGLVSVAKNTLLSKVAAVSELIGSLLPTKTIVKPPVPVVYEVVSQPKFYELPTPIIKQIVKK